MTFDLDSKFCTLKLKVIFSLEVTGSLKENITTVSVYTLISHNIKTGRVKIITLSGTCHGGGIY